MKILGNFNLINKKKKVDAKNCRCLSKRLVDFEEDVSKVTKSQPNFRG